MTISYPYTEYNVKNEIATHYRDNYAREAEKQRPWLSKATNVLFGGGAITAVAGVLGLVGAGVMAYFSVPYVIPVVVASAVAVPTGIASFFKSLKLGERLNRLREQLLSADIENYKLVKSYVKDVLPSKNSSLAAERKSKLETHTKEIAALDDRQELLDRQRKLALDIVRRGVTDLEKQIDVSRKELDFFKQEAAQAFGDDFDAAAQKPQPVVAAPPRRDGHSQGVKFIYRPDGDYSPTGQ